MVEREREVCAKREREWESRGREKVSRSNTDRMAPGRKLSRGARGSAKIATRWSAGHAASGRYSGVALSGASPNP